MADDDVKSGGLSPIEAAFWSGVGSTNDWLGKFMPSDVITELNKLQPKPSEVAASYAGFLINWAAAAAGFFKAIDGDADPYERAQGVVQSGEYLLSLASSMLSAGSEIGVATGAAAATGTAAIAAGGAGTFMALMAVVGKPHADGAENMHRSGSDLGGRLGFSAAINGLEPGWVRSNLYEPFRVEGAATTSELHFREAFVKALGEQYLHGRTLPAPARDAYMVCILEVLQADGKYLDNTSDIGWVELLARASDLAHAYCLAVANTIEVEAAEGSLLDLNPTASGAIEVDSDGDGGADMTAAPAASGATLSEGSGADGATGTGAGIGTHMDSTDGQHGADGTTSDDHHAWMDLPDADFSTIGAFSIEQDAAAGSSNLSYDPSQGAAGPFNMEQDAAAVKDAGEPATPAEEQQASFPGDDEEPDPGTEQSTTEPAPAEAVDACFPGDDETSPVPGTSGDAATSGEAGASLQTSTDDGDDGFGE